MSLQQPGQALTIEIVQVVLGGDPPTVLVQAIAGGFLEEVEIVRDFDVGDAIRDEQGCDPLDACFGFEDMFENLRTVDRIESRGWASCACGAGEPG